ncbi:hypothetical protein HBN83_06350 [Pseudomonas fragi]|uniref:hypothetical protein n=1 Tax=Pseudomonas fragi TaxID=296 RepID=UPI001472FA28|nr:hypothetical protein [Pseudomonas fragi]NNB05515.1 hypothetical protein [Pseudomonas fragi]
MNIKALAACTILAGLSGCVSNSVPSTGEESIVHIKAQVGDQMIARRLDAKVADNLQDFTFTGAEHTMELGIVMTGHRDSHRQCLVTIVYTDFEPRAHYTLTQTHNVMGDVTVSLNNADGKVLVREDNIPCV